MAARILAVILGGVGFAEQLGRVGPFAIGPGGPFVPGGGALMPAPALGALVRPLVIVGHWRDSPEGAYSAHSWARS